MLLSRWIRFVIFSIVIIALQVWGLGSLQLFRVATPFLYPVLLMLLPIDLSKVASILWAFIIAGLVDIFSLTPGLHVAALVPLGFLRPYLLKPLIEHENKPEESPSFRELGRRSLILLSEILLLHHFLLFLLDSAGLFYLPYMLLRFSSSLLFSWLLSLMVLWAWDLSNRSGEDYD